VQLQRRLSFIPTFIRPPPSGPNSTAILDMSENHNLQPCAIWFTYITQYETITAMWWMIQTVYSYKPLILELWDLFRYNLTYWRLWGEG